MTDFVPDIVQQLDSVVIAEFAPDRTLRRGNTGFLRLSAESHVDPWQLVIQPALDTLISGNTQADDSMSVLHRGLITLGDPDGKTRTLTGEIRNTAGCLTLIAGYDMAELETLPGQFFELNVELDKVQRELRRHRNHLEDLVNERTAELNAAKNAAEAASRAKTSFLAKMSHELRTPLHVILGMNDLALRRANDPKQIDHLGKARTAAEHLLQILSDILDLANLDAERLQLRLDDFRVSDILDILIGRIRDTATKKGLKLQVRLQEGLPMRHFIGDAQHLGQILLNLAGNAIKFTRSGSVTIHARVVNESPDNVLLRWEITDTGVGIDAEACQRLFTAFEQADNSTTRPYGGTGLGLAICQRLVHRMHGEIGVDSEPGAGSTFWFTVRLAKGKEAGGN